MVGGSTFGVNFVSSRAHSRPPYGERPVLVSADRKLPVRAGFTCGLSFGTTFDRPRFLG